MKWGITLKPPRKGARAVLVTALFLNFMGALVPAARAALPVSEDDTVELFRREVLKEEAAQVEKKSKKKSKKKQEETLSAQQLREERERAMRAQILLEEKKSGLQETPSEQQEALRQELKRMERELLQPPKKNRFRFGGDFDLTYDTNADRLSVQNEEGDTAFKLNPFVSYDLSGRHTDLRAEYRTTRRYNAKVAEGKDLFSQEMRLRFGRKIGKKTTLSLNDRLVRESQRVTSIEDGKRVRWDNSHRAALSYELNRKLTINLDNDYSRRDFPHENFDQDGDYQYRLDPNVFFQMTPKTRISAGYRMGVSRPKVESSDNTSHEVRLGYFGKITGKSTAEGDLSYNVQNPDAAAASSSRQLTGSFGYVWQATPKTSLRLLFSRSLSKSVSDAVSTTTPNLIKTNTFTLSDTLSFSSRIRIHRKISTEFSFDGSHSRTKTRVDSDPKTKARTITIPFQVAIDYTLADWIRIRLTYTFRYRFGDEPKTEEHRAHTWFVGTNMTF